MANQKPLEQQWGCFLIKSSICLDS